MIIADIQISSSVCLVHFTRPVTKNWLFAGSEPDGQHLAIMQSMAATCKANRVNFRAWMEDVLVRISTTPAAEIDSLLPHLWKQKIK